MSLFSKLGMFQGYIFPHSLVCFYSHICYFLHGNAPNVFWGRYHMTRNTEENNKVVKYNHVFKQNASDDSTGTI